MILETSTPLDRHVKIVMRRRTIIDNSIFSHASVMRPGFTLVEVLLAMTISSLLVLSVISATRTLGGARGRVDRQTRKLQEARRGLHEITCALRNVRRDFDRQNPAILGYNASGEMGSDRISLLIVSDRRSRPDGAESDQYEASFYLWTAGEMALPSLMCRRDHALDDEPEEGGIASVVAEGVVGLTFEYYNGTDWQKEWSELELSGPEAIRVTVAVVTQDSDVSVSPQPIVLSTVVPIHMQMPMQNSKAAEEALGKGGKL
jgi:general secretion pathway protein J